MLGLSAGGKRRLRPCTAYKAGSCLKKASELGVGVEMCINGAGVEFLGGLYRVTVVKRRVRKTECSFVCLECQSASAYRPEARLFQMPRYRFIGVDK
jgi:hypothetical protein